GRWAANDKLVAPAGKSGIRLLAERGLLSPALAAVHCVDLQADELRLLVEAQTGVVHCPRSNSYLGCGIAPLRALLDAGARVGLGTDSPNSAVDFDVFAELRAAVMHARARERDAEALSATEALELATLGGARALNLDSEVGSLVPGKRADIAVVALADTGLYPWEDPATAVVLGGSPEHVQATLVGGEIRYEKGNGEWQRHRSAAVDARRRMLASASAAPPGSATSR
ncbi:MAG: 5-methylthioadenosine/S-adenosylhomocysteine deaminase, partial [Gaiellaceae bacterium]|nr:5-methylthioadenosine/S-adenosylhomocysteine deaminase [Gaiellaceae bacterium]